MVDETKPAVDSENSTKTETKINTLTEFNRACNSIVEKGHQFHKSHHDVDGLDSKPYHNIAHIYTVEDRARTLSPIFQLTTDQQAEMLMAIAWHDSVINYDLPTSNNIVAMVSRHSGATAQDTPFGLKGNEAESFKLLKTEMLEEATVFSKENFETVESIISATYSKADLGLDFKGAVFTEYPYYETAVSQNSELAEAIEFLKAKGIDRGLHIYQPHFEKMLEEGEIQQQVLIAALSDLGDVGTAEKEMFFKNGDAEMRELYYNINKPDTLHRLASGEKGQDKEDRTQVVDAFMDWQKTEVGFAVWQALRFEKTIYLLDLLRINC